jgi:hypothetical protein
MEEKVHIPPPGSDVISVHAGTHVQEIDASHEFVVFFHYFRSVDLYMFFLSFVPTSCIGSTPTYDDINDTAFLSNQRTQITLVFHFGYKKTMRILFHFFIIG